MKLDKWEINIWMKWMRETRNCMIKTTIMVQMRTVLKIMTENIFAVNYGVQIEIASDQISHNVRQQIIVEMNLIFQWNYNSK